jgi:hypothetical protein
MQYCEQHVTCGSPRVSTWAWARRVPLSICDSIARMQIALICLVLLLLPAGGQYRTVEAATCFSAPRCCILPRMFLSMGKTHEHQKSRSSTSSFRPRPHQRSSIAAQAGEGEDIYENSVPSLQHRGRKLNAVKVCVTKQYTGSPKTRALGAARVARHRLRKKQAALQQALASSGVWSRVRHVLRTCFHDCVMLSGPARVVLCHAASTM